MTSSTSGIKTWGRAGIHRRSRACPICRQQMQWGDTYRYDLRTQILWHVDCEVSPRFAVLQKRIADAPTIVPTFPRTTEAG